MFRCAFLILFLALGNELHLSHGTEVSVNNTENKLCLYANLMVNFSVTYEVGVNKNETVIFVLPENVTTEGSTCDNTTSTLKLSFGHGHSWTVEFTKKNKTYQVDTIVFSYNLNDSSVFPNSTSKETKFVTVKSIITNVSVDTYYSCKSENVLTVESVIQTLYDVALQAFVINGSKSDTDTVCSADMTSTTVAPTTTVTSTAAPTSTPTLPTPTTGKYSIAPDVNSTACLMATFGLQIGYKQGDKEETINLVPNITEVGGACGANSSDLILTSDTITIMFTFSNDGKKFHLHALKVTVKPATGDPVIAVNNNMSIWAAAVGSSYMCNKEQTLNVTDTLTLYTFELRVQPFEVNKGEFATAHECSLDDTSILIPIIVGAALAGLILIVVIAYVIGRRKTYVGYQTL
ncbi:lysosome-associated membrane glycoprotein 2 precursor [Salmo salar]|uniref:Lysosomal membrane glycoprotein 2 precursor n=1 Tax=Salmo salar TaxID=8030 RepID=B5X0Y5_SALSA|nr:lysosome-associated membrane glycoprotein 2 precursor [Salmo salar]ACI32966.1 Lysosome-associated membrane glycoprotein 2 precursor [Salmo salar]|eukprot:NP_001133282.1 lysosomal membrane glycoprotein 2 precursor [Salmo salar]